MLFPCTVCSCMVSLWALLLNVIIFHDSANNLCSLYLNMYLVSLGFWWFRAYKFLGVFSLGYIMFIRFVTFTYPCAICQRRCAGMAISTCIVFPLNMYHTKRRSIEISALLHIVIDINFFSLIMATIHAHGSFVPFTLPLEDDSHVGVLDDMLGLRFNLQIGTCTRSERCTMWMVTHHKESWCRRTPMKIVMYGFWVRNCLELLTDY